MAEDSDVGFGFPAVCRKKVTAAFDGGRLTSDGGVLLLAQAERAIGIAGRLSGCIADPRDQSRVVHDLADILRARMLAIACGYEDADDLDYLRHDPGFKLATGKLPDAVIGLASQPTMSRWENAPTTRELVRMMRAMVDIYCASYPVPPAAVTLDIDETVDVVHGGQQLSFWNGHYGERCFLPIHVYDTATGRPVAMLLRIGKTPSGAEIARHVRRLVRRIEMHWSDTSITLRGDGHYGRPEIMAWCEANKVDYVFGLPGNRTLHADPVIVGAADGVCVDRATRALPVLRRYEETRYAAASWGKTRRRVVARIEASTMGLDIRFVVTSQKWQPRTYLRHAVLRPRPGREPHQAAQDPVEQRPHFVPLRHANQMRLILHTAAYWLMWRLRQALPETTALKVAEFASIRLRLIKVAARVIETASRVRIALASACPDAKLFRHIALTLHAASP